MRLCNPLPLNDRVLVELAQLQHRDGPVFRRPKHTRQGEIMMVPYKRRGDGGGVIKTAWAGTCGRAGMAERMKYIGTDGKTKARWKPQYRPHDCRHTWATWFYAETRNVKALMELGG